MTESDWAYLSNDLVYGALFTYTIAFIVYTYETAFAVKANKEVGRAILIALRPQSLGESPQSFMRLRLLFYYLA